MAVKPRKGDGECGRQRGLQDRRWVRVLWRSWHCLSNEAGGWFGTNELTVSVRVGLLAVT
jgi:hypothetical protein